MGGYAASQGHGGRTVQGGGSPYLIVCCRPMEVVEAMDFVVLLIPAVFKTSDSPSSAAISLHTMEAFSPHV